MCHFYCIAVRQYSGYKLPREKFPRMRRVRRCPVGDFKDPSLKPHRIQQFLLPLFIEPGIAADKHFFLINTTQLLKTQNYLVEWVPLKSIQLWLSRLLIKARLHGSDANKNSTINSQLASNIQQHIPNIFWKFQTRRKRRKTIWTLKPEGIVNNSAKSTYPALDRFKTGLLRFGIR